MHTGEKGNGQMTKAVKLVELGELPDTAHLESIGKITVWHGQLDHVLRLTVKSIRKISVIQAMDATARQGSHELRQRVRKLALKEFGEGETLVRLDAFLRRAQKATDRRNKTVHRFWARDPDGDLLAGDDDHTLGAPPCVAELDTVANELRTVLLELNTARLEGFLNEALSRK